MRIHVGDDSKGEWLDAEDYDDGDEFLEACEEISPNFRFLAWDGVPDIFIKETFIDSGLWDYIEALEDFDQKAMEAFVECFGFWNRKSFEESYSGHYDSPEEMAEDYLEQTGDITQIPEHLRIYIDYEKLAQDMLHDLEEHNRHYFRNC
jgi:antirestriction protein